MGLVEYFKEYPEMVDRFVGYAFNENPNIQDLPEFKQALISSWDTPNWKNGVMPHLNDEEIIFLFKSYECKDKLKGNVSDEEFEEMYDSVGKGEFEVQRAVPKGQKTKKRDIKVVFTPKKISIRGYVRQGRKIKSYAKGYSAWTSAQKKFIQTKKEKGLTPKSIIAEYNKHFYQNPRSSSSIRTKIHRV